MRDFLLARRRALFFLALVLGSLALRWPALDRQIWNLDEGSTVTMAEMILHGKIPFRDAADNRTPLVPYLKAIVLAVAGEWNVRAIHVTLALMIGGVAVLLWQIGRRLGQESAGVFAALCFFWMSVGLVPPYDSLTAHTGWFLVFFSTLGFWLFSCALNPLSRRLAFACGVAFGFSYLAKQPGLLDFGVCLVIVGLALLKGEPARAWRLYPPLILGFLLPLAVTIAYFAAHGALDDLILYSWTYNTKYYVPEVPFAGRLTGIYVPFQLALERLPVVLGLIVLAWLGSLGTALRRLWPRQPLATLEWLILGWCATGLISTVLSGRNFPHYSIQVVPGFALACGWVLAVAGRAAARWWRGGPKFGAVVAAAAITAVILAIAIPAVREIRSVDIRDDSSNPIVGGVIQERSQPDDRLFIWGYMPEMYVFAKRLPASRYFYTNWTTGLIPWTNVDWFIDTQYAVIPGTPEILRAEIERQPPAMILDSGRLRAYLKYPLRDVAWLRKLVAYQYAEVDPDMMRGWEYRLYQRVTDAPYGEAFPSGLAPDARVTVSAVAESARADLAVKVRYPAGTEWLDLYKDNELFRRITCPARRPGSATFTVPADDLPLGDRQLQAVAVGRERLASNVATVQVKETLDVFVEGPRLEWDGRTYPPIASRNHNGTVLPPTGDGWNVDTPAKFVYERPPGLYGVEVEYSQAATLWQQPERWWTDGIEFAIEFKSRAGKKTLLKRRLLDARYHARDQGVQKDSALLPLNEPGEITVWFSPGRVSDSSADWTLIKAVRGVGAPLKIRYRGDYFRATHIETPYDPAELAVDSTPVVMVHAPSKVEVPLQAGMFTLRGALGLMANAWEGPKGSAGAIFEIWHVPPTGEPVLLHTQLVDPVHNESHRGLQRFEVQIPQPANGRLRFVTRPAHPEDNGFNFTYWADLVATDIPAELVSPDGPIPYAEIEANYGYNRLEEAGQTVTFAHAPSRIVFPLAKPYARLRGEIGLVGSAWTGTEPTHGAKFLVEFEDAQGRRRELWHRDLNPQEVEADRGFIPFSVDLPADIPGRLTLRIAAREGFGHQRAWTFWHNLRLER